jgi:hypothetical protein
MVSETIFSHRLAGLALLSGLTVMISQSGCKSSGTATTGPAGNASSLASKSSDPLLNSGGANTDPARATANKSGSETQATTADSSAPKKN